MKRKIKTDLMKRNELSRRKRNGSKRKNSFGFLLYICTQKEDMERLYPVCTLLICSLFSICVYSQTGRFFSSEQLSSSMISSACIAQDSEGLIWVGTEYGLNRYDGYHFTTFLHDEQNQASLNYNLVSTLLCEDSGQIWIGTAKGLDFYASSTGDFVHFKFPDGLHPRVSKIIRLKDGRLLVGTAGYGLYQVDEEKRELNRVLDFTTIDDDEFYSSLFEDSQGNLWKCDAVNGITVNHIGSGDRPRRFKSDIGTPMAFTERNGDVLILCLHGMLICHQGELKPYPLELETQNQRDIVFRTMHKDRKGNIYIGTRGHGLFMMPVHSNHARRVEFQNQEINLDNTKVWSIFDDDQSNLWIGCQQKGLLMIQSIPSAFTNWSFSAQKVSLGTPVTAICQGDNGTIWCSVQGNGIYGFDSHGKMIAHPAAPAAVEFIYRDRKGVYWVGTDAGLYQYDPLKGRHQLISEFECDKFNDLTDDGRGNIYISTFSRGFCRYNTQTRQLKNYNSSMIDHEKGTLCNNWVYALMPDHYGLLWIATATGVACYDPQSERFNSLGWESQLEGIMCYSLCEQPNGDILIGTDQGLYVYRRQEGKTVAFPHSKLLNNKLISYIITDKDGDVWCSTSMGIWQYKKEQGTWIGYIKGNGLTNREYTAGAGLHTVDNKVYFGTADGITTFNPQTVKAHHETVDEVHLVSIVIAGKNRPVNNIKSFTIPYQTNSFTIGFSLLNYAEAENTTFEYRLNENGDWTTLNTGENVISFNHLASGTYHLEVRAAVNGNYSPVSLYTFVVTTPWYKSSFAYLIYLMVILAITFFLIYMYLRDKRRQMDDEKMKFLINATHDIRSPLTLIMSPLAKLKQRHGSPEDQEELGLIEHNTQRILGLVNQILDVRKLDKQQMQLSFQQTNLTEYVNGIFKMYCYNASERNITYTFLSPETPVVAWIDHTQFDKVVSNLISNAFKYSFDGGHIEVVLNTTDDHYVQLSITDDGIGIKEEDRKRIFDRFYQSRQSESSHITGTGIGLNLCKMIVELHHGQIEAFPRKEGKGSEFVVRIPMGKEHLRPEELFPSRETPVVAGRPNTPYKLLFVDDDKDLCSFVKSELGHYFHMDCCYNGREAIRILLNNDYQLVISDVMMPEMDGFSLLRMIKKNPELNHIPVILLTSKSDIANRMEGLERGADAFMAKPFNIQELHVLVNSLISNVLRLKGKFSGAQQQSGRLETKAIKGNDEVLMEHVMKAISKNLDDGEFGVDNLAKEVGLSRTHLQRKMKELTGLNVAEFIRNIRLEQAARLLKEQKINVSQVAYSVGFSNLAHFSTVFKKHFGLTPTEYVTQKERGE